MIEFDRLVAQLRCPGCRGSLAYHRVAQREPHAGECGLLHCDCATYPVLDGVPIITRERLFHRSIGDDRVVADGPAPADVAALVEEGEGVRALLDLLAFPICPWPFNTFGRFRRLAARAPLSVWTLALRKRRLRRMLARRNALTAEDWLAAFYLNSPVPHDAFNYFFFKFGQPRHLIGLSLATLVADGGKAVLDLACGYGNVLHGLTFENGFPAVGLDQNFHQVWLARHYVAPGAAFVCADAGRPLPFADATFSAACCTDAFHCLHNKAEVLAELRRCTGAGAVLLGSVGNALIGSSHFEELTPDGYGALLDGWRWRVRTQEGLLDEYLAGRKPDLTVSSPDGDVKRSKFLSYVAAADDMLFRDHGRFAEPPHMIGCVQVNPIYSARGSTLHFRFPSRWYGTENRAMLDYMPRFVNVDETPRARLVAGCVLVGLPRRYARPAGRPRVFFLRRFFNFYNAPLVQAAKSLLGI